MPQSSHQRLSKFALIATLRGSESQCKRQAFWEVFNYDDHCTVVIVIHGPPIFLYFSEANTTGRVAVCGGLPSHEQGVPIVMQSIICRNFAFFFLLSNPSPAPLGIIHRLASRWIYGSSFQSFLACVRAQRSHYHRASPGNLLIG